MEWKSSQGSYTGVEPKIGVFTPPKSSILIGFSTINHPFWGTPIFGNTYGLRILSIVLLGNSRTLQTCAIWKERVSGWILLAEFRLFPQVVIGPGV